MIIYDRKTIFIESIAGHKTIISKGKRNNHSTIVLQSLFLFEPNVLLIPEYKDSRANSYAGEICPIFVLSIPSNTRLPHSFNQDKPCFLMKY